MSDDKNPETPKPAAGKSAPGLKEFKKDPAAPKPAAKPAVKKTAPKAKPAKPRDARSGVSFPLALIMAVIAAGAGAAGGWLLPKMFDPANAAPAQAITQNAQAIKAASQTANQTAQAAQTLQTDIKTLKQTVQSRSSQASDIAALQAQVETLESIDFDAARAAAMAPVIARVDALETIITPEGEDTGVASQLLERLTALETRLTELQAVPPVSMEPTVLSYSKGNAADENAAENAAETASDTDVEPAEAKAYDLAANFPREDMLKALSIQSQNTEEPSWLRKLIGKHIQTDDLSAADARASILRAQAMAQNGDIAGAVETIETLNPTLRAAAHGWMIEAKAVLK